MSALILCMREDYLLLSMDTLVSCVDKGITKSLSRYATKMHILPHINCVICGVESAEIKFSWYDFVTNNNSLIVSGISSLDSVAQYNLQHLANSYSLDISCDIYQFGICEYDGKMKGFVYRSKNNYMSEKLQYNKENFYIRPEITGDYIFNDGGWQQELFNIMKMQKENQDSSDAADKVYIGGVMQILEMKKDVYKLVNYRNFGDVWKG